MISQQIVKLSHYKSLYLAERTSIHMFSIHDRGIQRGGIINESLQSGIVLLLRGQPVIVMDNLNSPVLNIIYLNYASRPL